MVTINSATLVNKGLEVIEAHLLFGIPFDRIEVVVHPTSVVHSMVEFVDGSTLVQASPPTMLIPIALGAELARPGARHRAAGRLDQAGDLGVLPPRRRRVSRGVAGERAAEHGWHGPGGLQRRERGMRRSIPAGRLAFRQIVPTIAAVFSPRRTLDGEC